MIGKTVRDRAVGRHARCRCLIHSLRTALRLAVILGAASLIHPGLLLANQTAGHWWGGDGLYPLEPALGTWPQAIHLALLRGQADSSIVLYWTNPNEAWVVPIPDGTYAPEPDYFDHRARVPVSYSTNMFCSGHSSIGGKLLVTGGAQVGTPGPRTALLFDPKKYFTPAAQSPPYGWIQTDDMSHGRFYPTQVSLGDGKAITYSGTRYYEMMTLGGATSQTALSDSLIPLALTQETFWTRYPHRGDPATAQGPTARKDHTASWSPAIQRPDNDVRGIVAVYGGRTATTTQNELWAAWRTAFDPQESWNWELATSLGPGTPPARSEHAAAVNQQWNDQYCCPATDTLAVFLFGGLDENSTASGDVWLLRYFNPPGDGPFGFTTVKLQPTIVDEAPGPRYGHTAVFDPGPKAAPNPRMLVFGGRDASGALANRKVYALTLKPPYEWSVVAAEFGAPPARYRHTAVFDPGIGGYEAAWISRMVICGGQGGSALLGDVWALCRVANQSGPYMWNQWSTSPALPGRFRHSAIVDNQFQRMVVYGGDLSFTGPASLTGEAWSLPLTPSFSCAPYAPVAWQAVTPDSFPAGPRAGHSAVYYDYEVNSRLVEKYGSSQNSVITARSRPTDCRAASSVGRS